MSEKTIKVEIVTPNKVIYSGDVESITLPGSQSPFQVLFDHAPIVSSLDTGIIKIIESNGAKKYFASTKGFVEVLKNKVSVVVEHAEDGKDIDPVTTNQELLKAKSELENANSPENKFLSKAKIHESQVRLKATEKYKEN
jgi:F-type H+-transporting ATPase subunit epsilon